MGNLSIHLRLATGVALAVVAAAGVQGAIGEPLALVAVLGALGVLVGTLAGAGAGSREPRPVPVKSDPRLPAERPAPPRDS